jgi:hypothetical protein
MKDSSSSGPAESGSIRQIAEFDPAVVTDLDFRDLAAHGDPLSQITAAADQLPPGGVLHLRSPFEPLPLYGVMAARGFEARQASFGSADWSSWFWRSGESPRLALPPTRVDPVPEGVIDLRAMPAPEPMNWILEHLPEAGSSLKVMLPWFPEPLANLLSDEWQLTSNHSISGVLVTIQRR